MGKSKSPSRSRPGWNDKIHKMDFGITRVDLALENSNPLTTHIVLYWKYSVEKKNVDADLHCLPICELWFCVHLFGD